MKTPGSFILGLGLVLGIVFLMGLPLTAQVPVDLIPVGTVVAFGGPVANIPDGWLLCDGSVVIESDFPALFAAIGFSHGRIPPNGRGDEFLLPDYRGRFLRGVDHGAGRDPDSASRTTVILGNTGDAVGSLQSFATAIPSADFDFQTAGSHAHGVSERGLHQHTFGMTAKKKPGFIQPQRYAGVEDSRVSVSQAGNHRHTINSSGSHVHSITGGGDSETRPVNAYVNWIIKAIPDADLISAQR